MDEVQDMVIDLGAEMREQQAGEQHAGGAEADAAHFELAEEDAGKGGQADPEGGSRRAGTEQQGLYHFHCLIPFKKTRDRQAERSSRFGIHAFIAPTKACRSALSGRRRRAGVAGRDG